jgi:2-keto-3-deoxy-L-fuconate dehydrogenase
MPFSLTGKTAVVTAAGQGIGRAIAEAYRDAGARVIASDIDPSKLQDLTGVEVFECDVTSQSSVSALADFSGKADILANVAGFVHHGDIMTASEEEWDFGFNLNVKSMFRTIRAFLPGMIQLGGGSIINMASVASNLAGVPNRLVYGASKAAVIGLTKQVARDFISSGVRCNAIAPGTVQSPSLNDRINAFDDPVQARKDFIARQPLGRLGTAEEIASVALYLASDEAAYTTGTVIVADGGLTI